jgi:hypothetical protein
MLLSDIEIMNQCMSSRTFDSEMFHAWNRIKKELVVSQKPTTNSGSMQCPRWRKNEHCQIFDPTVYACGSIPCGIGGAHCIRTA